MQNKNLIQSITLFTPEYFICNSSPINVQLVDMVVDNNDELEEEDIVEMEDDIVVSDDLLNIQEPSIQTFSINEIPFLYKIMRLNEWLHFTRNILHSRLVFGYAKFGVLESASCPEELAVEYLTQQVHTIKKRNYKRKSDGAILERKYINFSILPDLGGDYFCKNHPSVGLLGMNCRSIYHSLTFILQKDSRIRIKYTQVSQVQWTEMSQRFWRDVC